MNTSAKGSRLEAKSIRWLIQDGAFCTSSGGRASAGKWPPRWRCASGFTGLVPLLVQTNRGEYAGEPGSGPETVQALRIPSGWQREIHIWPAGQKNPIVEVLEDGP